MLLGHPKDGTIAPDEDGAIRRRRHRGRLRRMAIAALVAGVTVALGPALAHPTPASAFYAELCNGGASQPQRVPIAGPGAIDDLSFSGWVKCPGFHGGQYDIILQKQRWDGWQNLHDWMSYPDNFGGATWTNLTYPCQVGTWTYRVVVNGWINDYVGEGVAPTGIGPWFSSTARYACQRH